jgi:hypothetical protein
VHAPSKEKNYESQDNVYEELEQVFDHFPKEHMKILLGNLNTKGRGENIFKPTTGNESLHQDRVKQFALRSINLFILFRKKELLPEEWKESIIVPIYKKGDETDCSYYRGI